MSYPIETYCDRCHTVHAGRCAPEFPVNLPMTTNSKPELCEVCEGTAEEALMSSPAMPGWHIRDYYGKCGLTCRPCTAPIHSHVAGLSADLLLDNFHWANVSHKDYESFRAELVRRLQPSSAVAEAPEEKDKHKRVAERLIKTDEEYEYDSGFTRQDMYEIILREEYPE